MGWWARIQCRKKHQEAASIFLLGPLHDERRACKLFCVNAELGKSAVEFDKHLYKIRHLVENLFAILKHFRSIATRFEKLARNFKAIAFIACTFI